MVRGLSQVMSGSTSLSVAEGHLSRCNVPKGSSLILAGESFPVLVEGSSVCWQGLLLCDDIVLL